MCCLFGILDYKQNLSLTQKNQLLRKLSIASEKRGTDATGIAYNRNGHMEIHKKPLPAHKFHLKIPYDVNVVMGHTRMTTQGNEKYNYNNHPFRGYCKDVPFSLAHNGVLYNEQKLRRDFLLPKTKIETDSYVAVQMIEKTGAFTLKAIQTMAEEVEGSFCFTLLDRQNNLYLVKGNNPLTIYHFAELGFYIYASTEDILKRGLKKAGFGNLPFKEIEIHMGDILILQADGCIQRETFQSKQSYYRNFCFDSCGSYMPYLSRHTTHSDLFGSYLESLIEYAANVGISESEILCLYENGFQEEEIEILLASPKILQEYAEELMEVGFV